MFVFLLLLLFSKRPKPRTMLQNGLPKLENGFLSSKVITSEEFIISGDDGNLENQGGSLGLKSKDLLGSSFGKNNGGGLGVPLRKSLHNS